MAKYNAYVELSPHYESVVDLDAEARNPHLWQEYIVHEDMQHALEKICESIKNEHLDSRRSFWIQGSYGTGKSYAAIVLKHLFEDPIKDITPFLSKQHLLPYRNKFTSIREKGQFLVIWRSGSEGIYDGTHMMMEMEVQIRTRLKEKFGDTAFYGRKSLVQTIQAKINDPLINWQHIFEDPVYGLSEEFGTYDDFVDAVMAGNLHWCTRAARILRENGWALFASVDMFESWLGEIIEGNHLENTGIVFIWDEFTRFVRDTPDDNVLQRLSEYCKKQPFFMFLIVHVDPSLKAKVGEDNYNKILHRYHNLEFHITESAAYDLIGNSILIKPGMEEQWDSERQKLMRSIRNGVDFDGLQLGDTRGKLERLCPIHPMTLQLLATVAESFGAQQRTLFRFMKDPIEAEQKVGFIYYISNYGPDDWRWLTPDFLWDYFFTRESDIKSEMTDEARRCYQHYVQNQHLAQTDEAALHVFKAAMLLLAVMARTRTMNLAVQTASRKVAATKKTLYRCFLGELSESEIDTYLEYFNDQNMLRVDPLPNGDARIEMPFQTGTNLFEARLSEIRKKYTRYELFKKSGYFSQAIEKQMWDTTRSSCSRMQIVCSSAETNSIRTRYSELEYELQRAPYKIGLLVVTVADNSQYVAIQTTLRSMAQKDATGRLIICTAKEAFTEEKLDRWHRAITNKELADEEGQRANAHRFESEAELIVSTWATSAAESQIAAFYGDIQYTSIFGRDDMMGRVERDIISQIFPYAPEQLFQTVTLYKRAQEKAALAGIQRQAVAQPYKTLEDSIKTARAWDASTLSALEQCSDTPGARAVAALTKFLDGELAQGAKVKLDLLWIGLQSKPFGYYDTLACAYLLGYVLRFYKESAFSWVDNTGNPFPLTEANIATMVNRMCHGDVVNHTLSSGSETWQQFKPYLKSLFGLNVNEIPCEERARHYCREKVISSIGVPLWAIKYAADEKLGGVESAQIIRGIVDNLCNFLSGEPELQEDAMSQIVIAFKGRGAIRQVLAGIIASKSDCYAAFQQCILKQAPELNGLIASIGINQAEFFDSIKRLMQSAIYTWTEQQVYEKLICPRFMVQEQC